MIHNFLVFLAIKPLFFPKLIGKAYLECNFTHISGKLVK